MQVCWSSIWKYKKHMPYRRSRRHMFLKKYYVQKSMIKLSGTLLRDRRGQKGAACSVLAVMHGPF